jgi:hypothetical protein
MPRPPCLLISLQLCMGVVAFGCGLLLAAGQAGRVLSMRADVLAGTPFSSFLVPGLVLAFVVGGSQLWAAWAAARDTRWALLVALAAGGLLMGWIVGEVVWLGWIAPHGLQPFCFAYGAVEAALAARLLLAPTHVNAARRRSPHMDGV